MAPASGRRCRVVFVQKEQHAAQLPRAKQTAPPAQEDAPLFHEQCPSKTEQRRPCRLKLRRWQRNCESCSSIGAQHQADRIAGDDTGEVAEPEIDSPLTSLNDGSNGSNFYPIFVGESVLESRDSIEPQLLQSLLLSPSGESSSVTSLHFFVDGSLPRQHLDLVESFAQRLGCSECFPGPRSGAEAAALSPSGSSHQQLPKTQQGPLLPATGSPCPATQASCSQEQLTSDPAGLSGLPQRPVRLWFLKGELGEGLKCREALIEVQDALIFDNPSHSRRTHYITTLSNRLPKDNRDKPVATCTDISPSSPVPPVERRDAGSTAKSSPFDRRSLVFAVGGGTVCDLVGFAAATALRGVKCVLVPTTLLAAVDAAVGGKNGIDVGAAKNCLGTFAHPHAVLVHLPFLRSLSPRHFANGMAEVIKIATTSSTELFEFLSRVDPAALVAAVADSSEPSATGASNDPRKRPSASPALRASDARTVDGKDAVGRAKRGRVRQTPSEEPLIGLSADTAASHREAAGQRDVVDTPRRRLFAADPDMREGMNSALETVILAAIQLKAAVVAEDFREGGKRQILNFGHTIGHGIEMLSRSSDWLHGESVAVGMVLELLLLRLLGLVSPLLSIRVQRLLRKFSLPCSAALSPKDAEEACRLILAHDKKNRAGNVFVTHVLDVGSTHPRHVTAVPHELVRLVLSPVLALAPHRPCLPCSSLRSVAGHTASLPFDAVVSLPGSKSVANRVLLLAALRHCFIPSFRQPMHARPSRERFVLSNLPAAVDVVVMVHALQQLGLYGEFEFVASPSSSSFDLKAEIPLSCKASRSSPSDGPYFDPLAFASVSEGCLRLWVGDSGTASRFLLPFVAFLLVLHHCLHRTHGRQGCPASSPHVDSKSRGKELASERFPNVHSIVVDGGDQLRRRPMGSLAEAISRIVRGCRVSYLKTHGCLPIQLDVDEKVVAQAPTLMDYQEAQNPHADTTLRLMSRVFTDVTEWHVSASESSQFGSALLMLAPLAPYSVQLCLDIVDEQTDQQSEAPHSRVSQQQRQPGTSGEDRPRSWETPEGTCSLSSSPAVSTTSPSCHRKRMREECGTELVDAKYAGDGGSASGRRQYRDPPSAAVNPFVLMTQRLMRQWRFGVSQISSHSYQVCSVWPGVRGDCSTGQESGGRLAKAMKRAGVRKRDSCPQRGPDNFHEEAPASETAARRLSPEHGSPEGTRQQGVDDQKGEASEMTSADSPDLHSPAHWIVEADATAASYFMAMAAVAGGRVHLNVDRDGMPPDLETHSQGREERPARDDLPAQLSGQGGQTLRGRGPLPRALHKLEIPSIASSAGASADPVLTLDLSQMQDCFMTCAVLAAIASRGTTTSNADSCLLQEPADATAKRLLLTSVARRPVFHLKAGRTARLKESDRIAAAARGLKATGFHVDELPDGLLIGDIRMSPLPSGGSTAAPQRALTKHEKNGDEREGIGEDLAKLSGQGASTSPEMRDVEKSEQVEVTAVDSESDHRVAMSFAILGLVRTNVGIRDVSPFDALYAGAKPVPHLSPPSLHKTPTAPAAQPPDEHSQSLSPQVLLLVGMRGVGKSVLGKLAALEREWAFFDLDVVLEAWLRDREDAIRAPVDARLGRHRAVIDLSGTTDVSLLKLNRLRGFIEEEGMHAFREVESQALAFLLSSLRRMRTQNVSCARSAAEADARTQADEDLCKSRHQYPNSELCSIFNSVDERVSEAQAMRNLENPREPTDRLSVSTEQPMGRVDKLVHSDASLQEFLMRCEALGLLKCHSGGCVVSCGGGVVEGEGAMKLLEAEPLVVWVNATEQETVERALRKEGQAPSYFQPPKKATRSAAAEMGCIPSDSNGGGQQGGHSEQGTSVAVAARYREKVRLLYRERAVRYKKVAKFEFWTPPVQELLEGLDSFELSWWPMLSDSKTSVPPLGPPAGTASNCIPSVPSSSTFGPSSEVDAGARSFPASSASRPALPLPHLPTSVADHLAVAHPKEAQRLSLYLRAVHKVWQLFLFALLGPPLPVTPASCFVVCEEVLNWAAGSEATSHSQAGDGAYCRNPLDSPPECQAAQGGGASTAAAHHTKLTTWLEESRYVDAVELRADCLPALEAIERQAFYLRLLTGKPLIFTLRTQQDGGRFGPGNALYKEALALLLSGVCDGSENGATQLDDSFIRSGEEDKAHSSRGRTSPTSGGEPRFREPNGADQARSGSVRNDARSADFPKTELTAPVGHASSSGVPSESRSATNLSFAEEELHAVTEAAAYVSALSRASRLGFDWIDVEVRQVERLHTREERAAAETRKELWARAACRTAVWRPSEEPRTSHTGREAESSRFDSRASASADPTSRPVHARRFSAVSEDSEETTENSLLRGARRQFVEDIIMATPPGGRYIASLHVAWVSERDSDPVKRFYRHCLSSVACWYADVAKIVLAPPQSRLPAQTPLQERTSALEPGLVSAGESKPTNLQVPVLSQDGGDPGEGEESVACLLRSLVMGCASPPQSLNTDTAPRANGEQSRALRSEAGMPNGLELLIQRPLILLQSGAAGRLSRIENRCLTPTCLAGQDTTNVNTVYRDKRDGLLCGINTDYAAIVKAILSRCDKLSFSSSFLVVGAGGAARAAVCACLRIRELLRDSAVNQSSSETHRDGGAHVRSQKHDAWGRERGGKTPAAGQVFIYNRTRSRAEKLAQEFGVSVFETPAADKTTRRCRGNWHQITVIVGTVPGTARCELPEEVFQQRPLVVDMAYNPVLTPLVKKACGAGCEVVHGIELFVWQALIQSRYWVTSQGLAEGKAGEKLQASSDCRDGDESALHCIRGQTDQLQQVLTAKWLETEEGRSYRPIDLRPTELREILRSVEAFYRNVIDVEQLVTLREENFIF
ncbi:3-dehydroquinate synthase, related [Neospora caninum Liverpool]|uniref:3-dehydroquinate synthase, related n=1 Tax=Neospora caninum (strain Liverpool) TaxID=572307 RepID=F0VME0_NEOCL|nr:3-dehydroquinate synthase, related [Neospora caninum Liverpool]CBZ54886.1 3-dehydroquinate synthase, related [Neospora caninum Liverpool]|eukprot:XP_003884914.1 3-dehydroquinate synthase, related [Neospora caninum Liverpool]